VYSIIILAHNKMAYTRACLESILGAGVEAVEVVALDNGSSDETPSLLRELASRFEAAGGRFITLRHDKNVGCSTARNECMGAATGRYIVFMDNDTMVSAPQWLAKLSSVLESDQRARIVSPMICYPFEPHLIQCAGVGISRTGRVQFRGRGEARDDSRFGQRREVQAVISACMMFDADLPREIGGLDEAFNPIQYEDFDFCYRARSRGYKVIYTPDPCVYHWESVTSDGTVSLSNKRLIIKHGLLFKQRWRHMFQKEDGPSESEARWRVIEMPSLEGPRRPLGS
jgi:GT2 family glycosyltransferase